ncbi:MAG: carbamoyltransferase HypF [Planctomycetota bacterium]
MKDGRLKIEIRGAVQGVGFRPCVYRLARDLDLTGWVINDTRGVRIEAEGRTAGLRRFLDRLPEEKPAASEIHSVRTDWLAPVGYDRFEIRHSDTGGPRSAVVLPDRATCPACVGEVLDPGDRRHRYPFTNCTECGPRFTIIEGLPYDRSLTTMRGFAMCPDCAREYHDPGDRRFHAQPNACPACGPRLQLWDRTGKPLAEAHEALRRTAAALRRGAIVAVKGLGGFHLMCNAADRNSVARVRQGKPRRDKPLALMVGNLAQAHALCETAGAEELLASPEAPIVLLPRRSSAAVAENVAPCSHTLGLMLPSTPLHHLLMAECAFPLVATSGNLSEEPICTDEREAVARLGAIADLLLVHDRPIARHIDDSVTWIVDGQPRLLRRARGYAPLPIRTRNDAPAILAVGAHLKNTVALGTGGNVFVSQHIGDLETPRAMDAFRRVIRDFLELYEARPIAIAHDLHPDYLSSAWARDHGAEVAPRLITVQHHHAHLAACLAENRVEGPALGVIWDGTGYGEDGTIWGGEFLHGDARGFKRVAHLRPFRLPGGARAIRQPSRTAFALLVEVFGRRAADRLDVTAVRSFESFERDLLVQMVTRGTHAPVTTSAGRLFDGVAALLGLFLRTTFEGQAAMALEFLARPDVNEAYPLPFEDGMLDWRPLVHAVVEGQKRGDDAGIIAARFHNALTEAIVNVAERVGEARVALSGGCFQNRRLTERTARRLRERGFEVVLHRRVPPNDGGISLGQVAVAAARLQAERECT